MRWPAGFGANRYLIYVCVCDILYACNMHMIHKNINSKTDGAMGTSSSPSYEFGSGLARPVEPKQSGNTSHSQAAEGIC